MTCRITRGKERLVRNKKWLYKRYVTEGYSLREIGELINIDGTTVLYWMKKHKISGRKKGFNKGPKSWLWKGGINRITQAKKAKEYYGEKCQSCGRDDLRLHVHHKDENWKNNQIDNLMVLCYKCHSKIHSENPNPNDGRRLRIIFPYRNKLGQFIRR